MPEWTKVAQVGECGPGNAIRVEAAGKELALFNVDGTFYCTSNICPHQGAPLCEGMLEGSNVVCPWHAWVFDVKTGQSPVNPRAKIPIVAVKVDGQDVLINV